jgi:hypothetical protein
MVDFVADKGAYGNFPQDFTPKQMIEEVAQGRFLRDCYETRSAYK